MGIRVSLGEGTRSGYDIGVAIGCIKSSIEKRMKQGETERKAEAMRIRYIFTMELILLEIRY